MYICQGMCLLFYFVLDICKCEELWMLGVIIDDVIECIKQQVGEDEVILGLFGGVDFLVMVMLLYCVIGDCLMCVFVDNGLLCLNEGVQVMDMFGDYFGLNIIKVDVEDCFLVKLVGVEDLEVKCKVIGNEFVYVFDEEVSKCVNVKWLV